MAKYLTYEEFGAVGDGVTDDFAAICAAHKAANEQGLPIRANDDATYYIGDAAEECIVKTDVDWGRAHFVIDDREVGDDHRAKHIFTVMPDVPNLNYAKEDLVGISVAAGAKNLGKTLPYRALVYLRYDGVKVYNRCGINNKFSHAQDSQEVILVDKDGTVDGSTPVLFDYEALTSMTVINAEERPITIKGGIFTTYANKHERVYNYYYRDICISRSNVSVVGTEHTIEKEGEEGAPYNDFFAVRYCNHVLLKDLKVAAHKAYRLSTDANNIMGSYDLGGSYSNDIVYDGLVQTNSITDTYYWGIHGSNFTKNLTVKNCYLSRIDAHCGMYNCTIENTTLGLFLNIIGAGKLKIDGLTRICGHELLYMRDDYGSTWHGDVEVRNTKFFGYKRPGHTVACPELIEPSNNLALFHTSHIDWPFGYTCYLPSHVTIENCSFGVDGKADLTVYEFGKTEMTSEHNDMVLDTAVTIRDTAAGEIRITNHPEFLTSDKITLNA